MLPLLFKAHIYALIFNIFLIIAPSHAGAQNYLPSGLFIAKPQEVKPTTPINFTGIYLGNSIRDAIAKPLQSMEYNFNGTDWGQISTTYYKYDSKGRTIERLTKREDNTNYSKEIIIYDKFDHLIEESRYSWKHESWVLNTSNKHENTYDQAGRVTESNYEY